MDHILRSRPVIAAVAAVAASTVVLATTTVEPKPAAPIAPRVSVELVQLAALPGALTPPARTVAAASARQIDIGGAVQNVIGSVIAGFGGGALLGFIGAGALASSFFYGIPVVGLGLSPLIPVVAIAGAIVGAPIGAVVGVLSAIRSVLPKASAPVSASARATSSSSRPGTRSNRTVVKPTTPSVHKASAPQHRSDQARAGSGRGHQTASSPGGRH